MLKETLAYQEDHRMELGYDKEDDAIGLSDGRKRRPAFVDR